MSVDAFMVMVCYTKDCKYHGWLNAMDEFIHLNKFSSILVVFNPFEYLQYFFEIIIIVASHKYIDLLYLDFLM
jgi:hypothetical protein